MNQPKSQVPVLRAMARNYQNGHSWDHLDGAAVSKAADEIESLRADLDKALARAAQPQAAKGLPEPVGYVKDCNSQYLSFKKTLDEGNIPEFWDAVAKVKDFMPHVNARDARIAELEAERDKASESALTYCRMHAELEARLAKDKEGLPAAEVVSGYSGDPDSRGSLSVRGLDTSGLKPGDKLYAFAPPRKLIGYVNPDNISRMSKGEINGFLVHSEPSHRISLPVYARDKENDHGN